MAALFIAAVFAGCAEVNVIGIKSLEKDKDLYKGREISYKEDNYARSEIEINGINRGEILFFVYIRNNSNAKMEIRPEEFFLKAYFNEKDLEEGNGIKHWAFDPEKKIEDIEDRIADAGNEKEAFIGFNCCFSFFSFAAHVSNDKYTVIEAADDATGFVVRHEAIENEYDRKEGELSADKDFYRNEVLRRTTLKPGEQIGGLVIIPLPEKAKFIRVHLPFEKTEHTYLFELKGKKRK
jgi:hypothetical protein